MTDDSSWCCGGEGGKPCPPPFPIFPIVFPMIFPIGVLLVRGRLGARRQRWLEKRVTALEEKIKSLEG